MEEENILIPLIRMLPSPFQSSFDLLAFTQKRCIEKKGKGFSKYFARGSENRMQNDPIVQLIDSLSTVVSAM